MPTVPPSYDYSTGTISIADGENVVVGSGLGVAGWGGTFARRGDWIIFDYGGANEHQTVILNPIDVDELEVPVYHGPDLVNVPYKIFWISPTRVAGAEAVEQVTRLVSFLDTSGIYVYVNSAASVPDPSIGEQGQSALQPSTGKIWIKDGGVWVFVGVFKGFNPRGEYDDTITYGIGDVVSDSVVGKSFISKVDNNIGNDPNTSPDEWMINASGLPGPSGATILLQTSMPVTTYPLNTLWIDSDSSDLDVYQLNATPAWVDTGINLREISVNVHSTTTVSPDTPANVVNSGTPYAVELDFSIPKGDKGDQGQGIEPDATGTTAGKAAYDGQATGFIYMATDVWPFEIYVKNSATSGDWSPGSPVGGDMLKADNLSGLSNYTTARTNLGLGALATKSTVALTDLALQANNTILGNVSGVSATPAALTPAQITAILLALVGDTGAGGTKGLVPAPAAGDAAAGKFLKADGTWAVAFSDTDRCNALLERIKISKALTGYQRFLNAFADGFRNTDGIDGSSTNVDTSNIANGFIAPTVGGAVAISQATGVSIGDLLPIANLFDGSTATSGQKNTAASGYYGKNYSASPQRISSARSTGDPSNGYSGLGVNTAITLNLRAKHTAPSSASDGTVIGTLAFASGGNVQKTITSTDTSTAWEYVWIEAIQGSAVTLLASEAQFYAVGVPNNMTLVTSPQTPDASLTKGRILLEIDPVATPVLNTDLTAEMTCNLGANYTLGVLAYVGLAKNGRIIVETNDITCPAGTSFYARVKTLNNKNIPIHGVSITGH